MWKKQGGGKAVEVDKADISGLTWMKVPRTNQLGVISKEGLKYKFTGFRDQVGFFFFLCPFLAMTKTNYFFVTVFEV